MEYRLEQGKQGTRLTLQELFEAVKDKDTRPQAVKEVLKLLNREPANLNALCAYGEALWEDDCSGLASVIFKRCLELNPDNADLWNALGKSLMECGVMVEAESCFRTALQHNPRHHIALGNMGLVAVWEAQAEKAISLFNKSLSVSGGAPKILFNRSLSYLALKRWKEGWIDYDACLGLTKERPNRKYSIGHDEPIWDGSKDKTVACYGEQGIGDQINFGSCLPDLIRDSKKVVIDVDQRLANLFKRSFPEADVYGTLYDESLWLDKYDFDASVAIGSLPRYYRNADADFPGTPYLKADPERCIQWRALFDTLPGKKIGIAWNGGVFKTGSTRRSLTLNKMKPIFDANPGNTWISLEYKDPNLEGFDFIRDWGWAVRSKDYDDVAAIVSQLDLVVTVQTSIVHLAGALGIPCLCLVPDRPRFIYLLEGTKMPWYNSVTLFRQKNGKWPIHQVAQCIQSLPASPLTVTRDTPKTS